MESMPCFSCGVYRPDFETEPIGCLGSRDGMSGDCDLYSYSQYRVRADMIMELLRKFDTDEENTYKIPEDIKIDNNISAEVRYKNWNCRVRPLPQDMEEYIYWSFYDFEITKERWDIIVIDMKQEEIDCQLSIDIINNLFNKNCGHIMSGEDDGTPLIKISDDDLDFLANMSKRETGSNFFDNKVNKNGK